MGITKVWAAAASVGTRLAVSVGGTLIGFVVSGSARGIVLSNLR